MCLLSLGALVCVPLGWTPLRGGWSFGAWSLVPALGKRLPGLHGQVKQREATPVCMPDSFQDLSGKISRLFSCQSGTQPDAYGRLWPHAGVLADAGAVVGFGENCKAMGVAEAGMIWAVVSLRLLFRRQFSPDSYKHGTNDDALEAGSLFVDLANLSGR